MDLRTISKTSLPKDNLHMYTFPLLSLEASKKHSLDLFYPKTYYKNDHRNNLCRAFVERFRIKSIATDPIYGFKVLNTSYDTIMYRSRCPKYDLYSVEFAYDNCRKIKYRSIFFEEDYDGLLDYYSTTGDEDW